MSPPPASAPAEPEAEAALSRVRAAVAAGAPVEPADAAAVLAALDAARAESAARWDAIGRLAPAAKAQRGKARDLARLLTEARAALADGAAAATVIAQLDRGLGR